VVSIVANNLHWHSPDASSLSVHGGLLISHGDQTLVDRRNDVFNLGASALLLLRTFGRDQTKTSRVGDRLCPCIGDDVFAESGVDELTFANCPQGFDFVVRHGIGRIVLEFDGREPVATSFAEWKAAVLGFSDLVSTFYGSSAPRQPATQALADGFASFHSEWKRRVTEARPKA
jgi:hypothetical protein